MSESTPAIKVTLSSKKEVILREPRISDQETAMQLASPRSKDNAMLLVSFSQKELLKLLLLKVDGKTPSKLEIEQLDKMFTLAEYNQLQQVVGKLAGGDPNMGECLTEIVTSGDK